MNYDIRFPEKRLAKIEKDALEVLRYDLEELRIRYESDQEKVHIGVFFSALRTGYCINKIREQNAKMNKIDLPTKQLLDVIYNIYNSKIYDVLSQYEILMKFILSDSYLNYKI